MFVFYLWLAHNYSSLLPRLERCMCMTDLVAKSSQLRDGFCKHLWGQASWVWACCMSECMHGAIRMSLYMCKAYTMEPVLTATWFGRWPIFSMPASLIKSQSPSTNTILVHHQPITISRPPLYNSHALSLVPRVTVIDRFHSTSQCRSSCTCIWL